MSVKLLIENWVTPRWQSRYFVDYEDFQRAVVDRNRIIFIATLWSGRSQLAFRRMSELLSAHETCDVGVLVLDYEEAIPPEYSEYLSHVRGDWCAVLIDKDRRVKVFTKSEQAAFEASLCDFV